MIKKIQYFIKKIKYSTIVYTNYSITINIIKQTILSISTIDKLNLQLIKTQFSFDVRHKTKQLYITLNILFKLTTMKKENDKKIDEILNKINVFNENAEIIVVIKLIKQTMKERKNIALQNTSKNAMIFHIYLINMSDNFRKKLIDAYVKFIK